MSELHYTDEHLTQVLTDVRSIALVGASDDPVRASHFVMKYMLEKGYRVIPINPKLAGGTLLGQTVYGDLADLPEAPDMVDIFRNARAAGPISDAAIAMGAKVVWMQLGVVNHEAAARAEAAGLTVIMDRCPKMEYQRLFGEIGRIGVNSNVILNKRRPLTKTTRKLM